MPVHQSRDTAARVKARQKAAYQKSIALKTGSLLPKPGPADYGSKRPTLAILKLNKPGTAKSLPAPAIPQSLVFDGQTQNRPIETIPLLTQATPSPVRDAAVIIAALKQALNEYYQSAGQGDKIYADFTAAQTEPDASIYRDFTLSLNLAEPPPSLADSVASDPGSPGFRAECRFSKRLFTKTLINNSDIVAYRPESCAIIPWHDTATLFVPKLDNSAGQPVQEKVADMTLKVTTAGLLTAALGGPIVGITIAAATAIFYQGWLNCNYYAQSATHG